MVFHLLLPPFHFFKRVCLQERDSITIAPSSLSSSPPALLNPPPPPFTLSSFLATYPLNPLPRPRRREGRCAGASEWKGERSSGMRSEGMEWNGKWDFFSNPDVPLIFNKNLFFIPNDPDQSRPSVFRRFMRLRYTRARSYVDVQRRPGRKKKKEAARLHARRDLQYLL